ncbi:molybdopterin-synthase adenylyltransferase MoeB [Exilibacterium tricleocarpae]|uniref:Molybdopterin-synthase adenylyltransferase n=1 Tax=Exilibacterium tricleocarpae TaxID=2591008 RepID=A0A545U5P6_9GAMM|nr:molybdopterin-synthase adenylyltransferase MoeB [Exilibacterium tricleocarpae]TQV84790.1 molybdopterin-synthase adenylyltransferase MoeB [Exilibacterium tricleocarpae]
MNDDELLRYSRQIMLPEIDLQGQEKLLAARVLVVGLGGLGSPVAMYLAAAGVGSLVLADFDRVDLSNLQRQIVHRTARIGAAKVESAAATLRELNPAVDIVALECRLSEQRLLAEVGTADVVVDCSDNFTTRFALNRACVAQKTPLVSGAAIRLEGQVAVFDARVDGAPCYRCLYDVAEDENLSCAESGVLAPLVGIVGSVQALETIKLLVGFGECLVGRLLILDAKAMVWTQLKLARDRQCPVCAGAELKT